MSKVNKKDFLEEDLYKPVLELLNEQGYTVRGEVGHCDVAAVKGEELVVIEMKKSLNLEVILQAALRQRMTDNVYVAVPKPGKDLFSKRWKNVCYLLKRLGLGLMLVSIKEGWSFAEVVFDPAPFDVKNSKSRSAKKKSSLLKEFDGRHGDFNKGGSTRKKIVTAYMEMAIHIACCLEKYGPMNAMKLKELGTDEKKTYAIVHNNHYGWFDKVSKGVYDINEDGKQAIREYPKLVEYYTSLIENKEI
ncbi:MAG: DUF2161 family putative PD-(D/E)XK-type phosphodiesterase [Caulobacteraceae bacterium]